MNGFCGAKSRHGLQNTKGLLWPVLASGIWSLGLIARFILVPNSSSPCCYGAHIDKYTYWDIHYCCPAQGAGMPCMYDTYASTSVSCCCLGGMFVALRSCLDVQEHKSGAAPSLPAAAFRTASCSCLHLPAGLPWVYVVVLDP
jgi:hypothetical protein